MFSSAVVLPTIAPLGLQEAAVCVNRRCRECRPLRPYASTDGTVNADDLALWQSQFGSGGSVASATAVPEPNSVALLLLGAIALFGSTCGTYWR